MLALQFAKTTSQDKMSYDMDADATAAGEEAKSSKISFRFCREW